MLSLAALPDEHLITKGVAAAAIATVLINFRRDREYESFFMRKRIMDSVKMILFGNYSAS
jgi:hypothetical protein